ncbi:hypothetical protein [Streptomyces sp. NPDC002209]|uniref:hypothetical protein n=1 Tax=Streptomyces sp. NPDC002209 TaxID=3364638 RepID=UPI003697A176
MKTNTADERSKPSHSAPSLPALPPGLSAELVARANAGWQRFLRSAGRERRGPMPECYVPHPLLRRRVRDVASGAEGELMAVINENVSAVAAREYWIDLAYIRGASGREFSTSVDNIQPAADPSAARTEPSAGEPGPAPRPGERAQTAAGRCGEGSA